MKFTDLLHLIIRKQMKGKLEMEKKETYFTLSPTLNIKNLLTVCHTFSEFLIRRI